MKPLKPAIRLAGAIALVVSMTTMGSANAHHAPANAVDTGCGTVINPTVANTTFNLTHNIGPCVGHGLIVAATAVTPLTIKLNGNIIRGDGQVANLTTHPKGDAGILVEAPSGVTVNGPGTVREFNVGIAFEGGDGNKVERVKLFRNQAMAKDGQALTAYGAGIHLFNSSDNVIRANEITENAGFAGIMLEGDSDNNKIGNDGDATNNGAGTGFNSADANKVENNDEADSVFAKQTSGIRLQFVPPAPATPPADLCTGGNPDNNMIDGNKAELNGNDGIQLFACSNGNVIVNNKFDDNGRNGITLFPRADHNFVGVHADNLTAGGNVTVSNGNESLGDGINVGGSSNKIRYNTVNLNGDDGINLAFCRQNLPHQPVRCQQGGDNNEVSNNTVTSNGNTLAGQPPICPTAEPMCNAVDGEIGTHGSGIHAQRDFGVTPVNGAENNIITNNSVSGHPTPRYDLKDDWGDCTHNSWTLNTETTKSPACLN